MSRGPVQICAIAGGSGAGKTTLAFRLLDLLGRAASHHTIDWYYRDLSHLDPDERAEINFDHPRSLEVDLFVEHLEQLAGGRHVEAPVYDFSNHTRTSQTRVVESRPIIVAEGIHLLALEEVRAACTMRVFIDIDADIRLQRRLRRDVIERGRTHESVHEQWETTVAPMHDEFVQPSAAHADRLVTIEEDLDRVAHELAEHLLAGVDNAVA